MSELLRLIGGSEDVTFPNKSEFGEYAGKTVIVSYSLKGDGVYQVKGVELKGNAREFARLSVGSQKYFLDW
ncbi:hypothetical protein HYV89_03815 [Candidatus Woesearchaeota archaeon]|nr:hypothetical protein [Candidatus Woesearchaeota archaeon]